jgi:hypothetical protein
MDRNKVFSVKAKVVMVKIIKPDRRNGQALLFYLLFSSQDFAVPLNRG